MNNVRQKIIAVWSTGQNYSWKFSKGFADLNEYLNKGWLIKRVDSLPSDSIAPSRLLYTIECDTSQRSNDGSF